MILLKFALVVFFQFILLLQIHRIKDANYCTHSYKENGGFFVVYLFKAHFYVSQQGKL